MTRTPLDTRERQILDQVLCCGFVAIDELAQQFEVTPQTIRRCVPAPRISRKAFELVDQHRRMAHRCAIVSASHRFLAEPSAGLLGMEALVCTALEIEDSRFTGRIRGAPCYREHKVEQVRYWLKGHGLDAEQALSKAWFYSDSSNDLPLLECVAPPVLVSPDARLVELSSLRGWPVLRL